MTGPVPNSRQVTAAEITGEQVIAAVSGMVTDYHRMQAALRAVARAYHLQLTNHAAVTAVVIPDAVMAEIEDLVT